MIRNMFQVGVFNAEHDAGRAAAPVVQAAVVALGCTVGTTSPGCGERVAEAKKRPLARF